MTTGVPEPEESHALSTFHGNTLTVQELEAAYLARYDLGPGYPQLDVAEYVRSLYLDDSIEDLSLRFAPFWTPEKQAHVDDDLELAVRQFLSIPPHFTGRVRSTFSGSIALDRVVSAVLTRARRSPGYDGMTVVTTTPCIDIMKLFLAERPDVRAEFVESRVGGQFGALDLEALLSAIRRARAEAGETAVAVLLSSPENPTGSVWSADELVEIVRSCAELEAVLILDHCFAVAGVHDASDLVRIWDLADVECDWIAVWDTGKTFGLNEDKLGFIVCGTEAMTAVIDEALAVTQFGVARRQKMFFAELLRRAYYYGHIDELRATCRANLSTAEELAPDFVVRAPDAGSLLLLDVSASGESDEMIRKKLIAGGVGVVAGNVFFHGDWRPENYVRVALARSPEYFREAFQRVVGAIG